MCYRKTCYRCQKPTFGGCGKHVELVLGDIPLEDRCRCKEIEEEDTDPDIRVGD